MPRGPPKPVSILPKKMNSGELNCSADAYRKFPAVSMIKLAISGCLKDRFVHTLKQQKEGTKDGEIERKISTKRGEANLFRREIMKVGMVTSNPTHDSSAYSSFK